MILGFDTSSAHVGAALMDGSGIVAAAHEDMARGQAERLMPLLEEVLAQGGANWQDLSAIGVGIGPGNFTGVRLSVAAARGLALSLNIPAVGVSLLEAVALDTPGPVLACLSAPRDQAYVQSQRIVPPIPAQLIAISGMPDAWAQSGLTCVGPAAALVAEHLGTKAVPARHAPAEAIAHIAATRWQDKPARPAPLYLKPADAAPSRDAPPVILE
ncbi:MULTISPECIES: tRNA (adenosine(37)-N6)-threonylcarbamoyltransferase complex dimerization subunit type 1 TsaB [unclassified Mameliella]|uniref:tRNA (adenosine(37)-N6)-threonylcarbamoyltransferase complex dimerization subunit type 1 TsaB n=1 Tax=unclassified Mameliella TaxID=2630630 RepID=UPI00273FA87A|nr:MULTISPECIES: tRNA (adenosine(37)-N6)-threonylcarbamoyltransferase complex dimerization subunit type 1 TsaB [unclassified Mameliella]